MVSCARVYRCNYMFQGTVRHKSHTYSCILNIMSHNMLDQLRMFGFFFTKIFLLHGHRTNSKLNFIWIMYNGINDTPKDDNENFHSCRRMRSLFLVFGKRNQLCSDFLSICTIFVRCLQPFFLTFARTRYKVVKILKKIEIILWSLKLNERWLHTVY